MKVHRLPVGELACNCYLIEKDQKCLLIDPGDEYEKILEFINGKDIVGILITHGHFDHIGCLKQLSSSFSYPVYQYDNLQEGSLTIENFTLEVVFTPGHSQDSVSFYFKEDKIMFTGDFVFYNTVGRCDLEGGDFGMMLESIQKIKKYPEDVVLYPGHGICTTLKREKELNPYFNYE